MFQYSSVLQRVPVSPPPPSGEGDPHWENVKLLLGFNGVDGAAAANDEGPGHPRHQLAFIGDAQIDTAQSAFGGASLLLDASGDFINVADHDDWAFGSGDFTIEALVRFNNLSGIQSILSQWGGSGAFGWIFRKNNDNSLNFYYSTTGSNTVGPISVAWSPSTGVWYHLVAERHGADLNIYAVELGNAGTPLVTGNVSTNTLHDSSFNLNIGTQTNGVVPLNGWIDEVRITKGVARYQGTLPALASAFPRDDSDAHWDSIALLCGFDGSDGATEAEDEGPGAAELTPHALTFGGDAQLDTAQQAFGASSLLLDGAGDYVRIPDSLDWYWPGAVTVEALIRFSALAGGIYTITSQHQTTGNQRAHFFRYLDGSNLLQMTVHPLGSTTNRFNVEGAWTPVIDTWYHVAYDFDGIDKHRIYAAELGSAGAVIAEVTNANGFFNSSEPFYIGTITSTALQDYFPGWIDEVRITKGIARYQGTLPALTAAFPRFAA